MLWIWYFLFYTLWGYLNKLHCHNKLFVVNLVCFLNFNMNTSARLGIFLAKWLILRKIYFFCLLSCYYWYSNLSGMEYILAEKHSGNISALISHHSMSFNDDITKHMIEKHWIMDGVITQMKIILGTNRIDYRAVESELFSWKMSWLYFIFRWQSKILWKIKLNVLAIVGLFHRRKNRKTVTNMVYV